ncbi:MAG: response regulator [Eubacteriales bacterium]|nr:response regulator [Eubacteriales bacterium]
MYRALIVEDEDLMREYLAAKLNKLCPDWEAAATAADGMEAVERLAHERFDAVLTDIRMPGMDGLELARLIRRTDADIPILILSGYDEFDYARTAVRLNVFDYLLKPLNEAELSAALSAMASQVAARQNTKHESILANVLENGGEAECETLYTMQSHKPCGLALLAPAFTLTHNDRSIALSGLQTAAKASFTPFYARFAHCAAVLCAASDPLLVETECRNAVQRFQQTHPDISIRCGYANFDWEHPRASRANAEAALRLALALDEPLQSEHLLYEQRQAQNRLEAMLHELNDALASSHLSEERRASLLSALHEFPRKAKWTAATYLLMECDANESQCAQARNALGSSDISLENRDISARFFDALDRLFADQESPAKPASTLVQQARDYLQLRFTQPLSLASLAEVLGITAAYLSSIFHREMGLSYSQYLLQLRMEDAARRLLGDPAVKISDIGDAVGFPSAKHFTHVFRQYFKVSPTEYRKQKAKRQGSADLGTRKHTE